MRRAFLVVLWVALVGCPPPGPPPQYPPYRPPPDPGPPLVVEAPADPAELGRLDDRLVDFKFDGGQLEFELYSEQGRIVQTARNRYAVPVVISWSMTALDNVEGTPREIVILNAGVALYAANVADSIGDGITRARSAIASGAAKKALEHFIATTQKLSP